jgi:hypothetical protein
MRRTLSLAAVLALGLGCAVLPVAATEPTERPDEHEETTGKDPDRPPTTPPPPWKKEDEPRRGAPDKLDEELIPESGAEWGLADDLLRDLAEQARVYAAYTRRFICVESAREADYKNGEAQKERNRRYSYLLTTDSDVAGFDESRREIGDQGKVKKGEVEDEEKFPPAYAWVFLFAEANQPYFAYRVRGERFDGFDWVRDIEFRGALPFTDGKDIRQWEGLAVVNAVTNTPIEITAEPSAQRERIRFQFDRWARSFNLVGVRLAPRPFGFRCRVEFRYVRDGLNFPTRLRYDTFRAVSMKSVVPWKVSSRAYSDYNFTVVTEEETIGETAGSN